MLISSVLAAAASLLAFAWCANMMNARGIVLSACSFQCFTIAAWNVIDTLTSELFPTAVRSTGMGVCAASGRIGAMLAQFVNGALVGKPIRLLLVASGTLLLGAVTPCLLPHGDITGQPVQDVVGNMTTDDALYTPLPRPLDGHSPRADNTESSSYQSLAKLETTEMSAVE
jgi:MFS family permease